MASETRDIPGVDLSDRWVGRITVGATLIALAMSYRNQLDFATQHGGYPVWLAVFFPLMIDSFVVVGELRLFSATARDEGKRIKAWAWVLTLIGLAASVAAGMAHVGLVWWPVTGEMLAAAVAPLAAAASLGTGLGIVKLRAREAGRAVASTGNAGAEEPAAAQQRPRGTASAAPARSRARHLGQRSGAPSAGALERWIAADTAEGLPMGRRAFAARHEISEHHARAALSNGHAPVS